ncbi:zinc metalloprotease [Lutibacter sp.]|uniref:zinc metalloprotease n=1 Tax=Lutibacter sp. TaxID=1925666 RepID=UPI0027354B03|nr:zinc metalloprotease [Lutibacter sp.]MDP3311783.1 zinc metalloprotease [Lutibacter sp.]
MKKLILSFVVLALVIIACQPNSDEITPNQEVAIDMSDFYVYTDDNLSAKSEEGSHGDKCYSMKVLNQQLKDNPGLENRMFEIEKHTRTLISNKGAANKGKPGGGGTTPPTPYVGTVTIPVIINILEDAAHPVTQAHINSQIAILNDDFNNNNARTSNVPSLFAALIANTDITFVLAGVNRKASTKATWGTNNSMKYTSQGGWDATDPANYLNIWVCEIGGGILGYAQFPGGALATDGIVIGSDFLGENTAGGQYGHGRTATHEVGHWLNLRHIWGDGRCSQDDFVTDTPSSDRANYGCPSYPTVHCSSADMTMNYMDYTDDNCMYMFTNGQNDRMRTIFASGGSRISFVQ